MAYHFRPLFLLIPALLGSVVPVERVMAQECAFDLGPDTILCAGQNILLGGPAGALSTVWQNGWEVQYLTADTSGTYWCTATFNNTGDDLVINGDFDQGATGFTTDLVVGTGGTWGPLSLEGTYGVTTDPSLLHYNFSSCSDHSGSGSMLLLNGSSVDGENVWCQTISVQPNTTYAFSAWVMSASPENPAILTFTVNGVDLGGTLLAAPVTCIWDDFYALWNSGTSTTANICIANLNLAESGNDFALDDIAFSPLCTSTDSITVTVLEEAPEVMVEGVAALCPGVSGVLRAIVVPADGSFTDLSYAWNTGATTPEITVTEPGSYDVQVVGRCMDDGAVWEVGEANCESQVTMPNVFTPDGDGINDTFGPIVEGEPQGFDMEIRNRWGQMVFSSASVQSSWNGRVEGTAAPAGTYFWNVRFGERMPDGGVVQKDLSGHLTLLNAR